MPTRSAPCLKGRKFRPVFLFRPQPDSPFLACVFFDGARSYLSRFSSDVYEYDDLSPSGALIWIHMLKELFGA
ncbi:hypothetical protein CKAN_00800900 [Cinnamomum micranthum f. kanehirae]|uniref:Uncharacterized protein n=1 Tax=Cinnamomum micranthum f. kanehirae TaxID=337451 RepID=A0A3S3N286_9MAGN|nr:hypothetical protein CKAN_00800900 [Cinnamomum micranthum f. kanehirae]